MKAEGVVCFHMQGNFGLKKTLEKDEEHKSMRREDNAEAAKSAGNSRRDEIWAVNFWL
jgi:hypothetical protein